MASIFSLSRIAPGGDKDVSAGAGPFAAYQPSPSVVVPAPRHSDGSAAHAQARNQLTHLQEMHRVEFPAAAQVVLPVPRLPRFHKLLATAEKQALRGVGRFDRPARRAARETGREQAEAWASDLLTLATHERETQQMSLDARWEALLANDRILVAATIAHAYAASDAPARLVEVVDGVGFVEVRGPADSEVPTLKPWHGSRGAATVLRLSTAERAQWHRLLVAAHVLLVAKQTLAVAPGLTGLRLMVMRPESGGSPESGESGESGESPGSPKEPLLAVTISRERLGCADFSLSAGQVLARVGEDLMVKTRGGTGEMQPIRVAADSAYGLFLR